MILTLPIKTKGGLNNREHFMARHRRVKKERETTKLIVRSALPSRGLPCTVRLTRISSGTMDDDGCVGALKSIRDGIADALEVDDGDSRIHFFYAQEKCKRGGFGVRVQIEACA
jgi:hypothetical protein